MRGGKRSIAVVRTHAIPPFKLGSSAKPGANGTPIALIRPVKLLLSLALVFGCAYGAWARPVPADFESGKVAYETGDYAKALQEWEPLAAEGAPHAQYNVALMYAKGLGVPVDLRKAAELYEKAAAKGIVPAQYNIALMYQNGEGVPKDNAKALKWFQRAANNGDPNAATGLAAMLEDESAFRNQGEAEKWYRKLAEQGIASAQFNLAVMYDIGHGVKPDYAEAVKWYRKAADQNYAPALCNLGILYYNGQGVKMDRLQAQKYFMMAKAAGEPRATDLMQWTTNKLDKKQMRQASDYAATWSTAHPNQTVAVYKPNFDAMPAAEEGTTLNAKTEPASPAPVAETRAEIPPTTAPRPVGLAPDAGAPAAPVAIAATASPTFHPESESPSTWSGVSKVVAVGDLDGDYTQFVRVLRSAGLIDDREQWVGGTAHLVQTGDVLGQAGSSRQIMDLLMSLERQASAAGGAVHCLIGRQEAMNLTGDLRQVAPGEYGMYREQNSEQLRQKYYERYVQSMPAAFRMTEAEWMLQHPLGFFEREGALASNGIYGQWLRTRDTVVKINGTLYVNAGLGQREAAMGLAEINDRVRHELTDWHMLDGGIVMDPQGPLRFHGMSEGDQSEMANLDQTLEHFGAQRIVIGHSDRGYAVVPRFNGKVILIDAGLSRRSSNVGQVDCLLEQQGKLMALHRGVPLELPKDDQDDLLRYLKQAAALDPAPSPLEPQIKALEAKRTATL